MLRHIGALVCLLHGDRFPCHCLPTLLQAHATLSTIANQPFPFAGACPTLDFAANWRSNPIAHRVRRKRQRLPPSLLIENASDRDPRSTPTVCPEAFPIKASDNPGVNRHARVLGTDLSLSRRPNLLRQIQRRIMIEEIDWLQLKLVPHRRHAGNSAGAT